LNISKSFAKDPKHSGYRKTSDDDLKAVMVDGKWKFVHKDGSPYKSLVMVKILEPTPPSSEPPPACGLRGPLMSNICATADGR
jgi:hypothetical protein